MSIHTTVSVPCAGEVAGLAGEAGLPVAGLVGVALKLGSRLFRGDSARTGGGCTLRH